MQGRLPHVHFQKKLTKPLAGAGLPVPPRLITKKSLTSTLNIKHAVKIEPPKASSSPKKKKD